MYKKKGINTAIKYLKAQLKSQGWLVFFSFKLK